jgi:hypothetical protein
MKKELLTIKSKKAIAFLMMIGTMGFYSQHALAQAAENKTKPAQVEEQKDKDEDGEEDGEHRDRSINCGGVERWAQKTLTDAAENTINFTPVTQTVSQLAALTTPTPSTSMLRTGPVETTTYTTHCNITIKKAETDNDYHLVLSDGTSTVIGEIPDPTCSAAATSPYVNQFIAARNFIDAHIASGNVSSVNIGTVVVTGVGFVDPPHGQTGAAPNNFEIHPIIDIHFETATGIEDLSKTLLVNVGPNPFSTSTEFKVFSTLNNLGTCSLVLYDMLGQEVKNVPVQVAGNNTIDFTLMKEDLKAGIYIYRLKNNGSSLYEGKIMVQ